MINGIPTLEDYVDGSLKMDYEKLWGVNVKLCKVTKCTNPKLWHSDFIGNHILLRVVPKNPIATTVAIDGLTIPMEDVKVLY
jgi:hypothetical protein